MTLHGIQLTASEDNWRLFTLRKADPAFLKFQEKVFIRDGYTCQFCGFRAKQYQEVINYDGNYHNNKLDNLVTSCSLCSQCFFLESIGQSDFGGGSLIYLPELSQAELNGLCHTLFVSLATGNSYSATAKNVYRSLKLRVQLVEKQLGEGFSNPALYGRMLIEIDHPNRKRLSQAVMQQLRLLPTIQHFVPEIINKTATAISDMLH